MIPRRSLRLIAQGSTSTVMDKAQKRAKAKVNKETSGSGIPLLSCFPFSRLTLEEFENIFRVYNIKLGSKEFTST